MPIGYIDPKSAFSVKLIVLKYEYKYKRCKGYSITSIVNKIIWAKKIINRFNIISKYSKEKLS